MDFLSLKSGEGSCAVGGDVSGVLDRWMEALVGKCGLLLNRQGLFHREGRGVGKRSQKVEAVISCELAGKGRKAEGL